MKMSYIEREWLGWLSLALIVSVFGFFYFGMIFSLPLFGDAASHGSITKEVIARGVLATNATYPPVYSVFQGVLVSLFGEEGMNAIVFLGVLLIGLSVFLLTKELTNRISVALVSAIIVLASPKLIFYSARMYMEILISGLFVFTIFLLLRFVKDKSNKNLFLLVLFTSVTASIKQQGLFILFPSILASLCCFFIIERRWNKDKIQNMVSRRHIVAYLLIFLLLIFPAYLVVVHTSGEIVQGSNEFDVLRKINYAGQRISGYKESPEDIKFNEKWGQRLEWIQEKYWSVGTRLAETRHIWPLDPITSWDGFTKTNGLYLERFWGGSTSERLANSMNILMLFGLILFVLNIFLRDKILGFGHTSLQRYFLIFLLIFLIINYAFFFRNTDQTRYHLFIAIIFSLFSAIGIYFLVDVFVLMGGFPEHIKILTTSLIVMVLIMSLITLAYEDSNFNKRWYKSQIYRPSKGGIASIKEAGEWLDNHTEENARIWQSCGNELAYYSEREVTGNFWFYFLEESELREIFRDQNVEYIVILDSQIVDDEKWRNLCWVPKSFAEKIKKIYPLAYRTSFGDINIYKV